MATLETGRSVPGPWAIASGVCALAVALMAWDHLWGNEGGSDSFPVDAPTFFLALGLVALAAVVVFGVTVPRAARDANVTSKAALVHSVIAVVLAVPASWLGFPVVVAGGGLALGLTALAGPRRRAALWAVALAMLVCLFAVLGTAFPPTDTD